MATISLKQVQKTYEKNIVALETTDLEIHDGEFFVLLGPSGCGKSTTLRLIAGLEQPDQGQIQIGDKIVNTIEPKDRNIAMVFQNYALYPHMNVYDNMAFGLKMRNISKSEIEKKITAVSNTLGLADVLKRKPKALSGGQRQRVALGRAIVRDPDIFLFDEPLSNLDAQLRTDMRKELSLLYQRLKTTMVYVTHDQIEAMTLATRICIMNKGIIQQIGTPLEIYRNPINTFVASFIGTPPMNLIAGEFYENHFCCANLKLPLPKTWLDPSVHHKATLGIRPEQFKLHFNSIPLSQHEATLEGNVVLVERLGHEQLVYVNAAQFHFIAKISSDDEISNHQQVAFRFNIEQIHFFDEQQQTIAKFT